MNHLVESKAVRGISHYKCKRILDMFLLACYAGLAGLYAEPTDLRVAHGVYPLPTNSATALSTIFRVPEARSKRDTACGCLKKRLSLERLMLA